MKKIICFSCVYAMTLFLSSACGEKCEVCKECEFDDSNYPQNAIDSTNCVDKELCGTLLTRVKAGELNTFYSED